jgi:hypothetical protein
LVFSDADLFDGFGGVLFAWVAELPAHDYIEGVFHPWTSGYTESFCQGFAVEDGFERVCVEEIQFLDVLEEV